MLTEPNVAVLARRFQIPAAANLCTVPAQHRTAHCSPLPLSRRAVHGQCLRPTSPYDARRRQTQYLAQRGLELSLPWLRLVVGMLMFPMLYRD